MQKKLNLVIPMAGQGNRFREQGYSVYKPFIEINKKPMIKHIIDNFPSDVQKHIIVADSQLSKTDLSCLNSIPNLLIYYIAPHNKGPAYTLLKASSKLQLNESFFISYSDILWTWNFYEVQKKLDADGIVFTRRKFHPHLIQNNCSAFCLPDKVNPYILSEIKEKTSF